MQATASSSEPVRLDSGFSTSFPAAINACTEVSRSVSFATASAALFCDSFACAAASLVSALWGSFSF
jgi:hypothetical protein